MGKIVLYYKYVDIAQPERIMAWQKELCQTLDLKGRVLIAHEGINGTLGGTTQAIETYKQYMKAHSLFNDIDFKESDGSADHFPKLKIKVKKEIVRLELDTQLVSAKDSGNHLEPAQVHTLLTDKPEDLVLLDGRNNYESRVGAFEGAIKPDINNFRDLPAYIDQNLHAFKDKHVVMYCTGGVRCERASAYLKLKAVAKEVSQIKGGIHRYIEQFPDGFFRGKNYVFDARVSVAANNDILATCQVCSCGYDEYTNCINAECNKQIIVCPSCIEHYHNTCSTVCLELVQAGKVNIRTIPTKIPVVSDH